MSFYNSFQPQYQAPQTINRAGSMNWLEGSPLLPPTEPGCEVDLHRLVTFPAFPLSPPAETGCEVDQDRLGSFSALPLLPPAETGCEVDLHPLPSFPTGMPLSPPAETTNTVDQHTPASFSADLPPAIPDALPPASPSQPQDESELMPDADFQALCRAAGYAVPDFAAMPPVPYPLEPATSDPADFVPAPTEDVAAADFDRAGTPPTGYDPAPVDNDAPAGLDRAGPPPSAFEPAALSPTGFTPPPGQDFAPMANLAPYPAEEARAADVPAALNRRRKAQRQLKAILEGGEIPQDHKRGRKTLPLGAPKAKYIRKVPSAPKPPPKPKRTYTKRIAAPADLTSVRLGDADTVAAEIEKEGWYGRVGDGLYGG